MIFARARERDDHCIHGRTKINDIQRVHELLLEGADVNATDSMGRTPWRLSSRARKCAAIREMLKSAGAAES